ncbi:MAG TPA: sigma-70 family RNA polymerase sigma factor [Kofleriaceae bacterium]|nr:sigma-70 family RNA polymerase sigma factor [Kofleriaceae bacterium]
MGDLDHRLSSLMARAQDGDRGAYAALLAEVATLVEQFARARVRQADACEEIVQDTLLAIHRDRHTYDPARPFRPWMYAVARHRLLDHLARQRRWRNTELLTHAGLEELAQEAPGMGEQLSDALRRALSRLSHTQQQVIEMLKVEGCTVAEISQRTGLSVSTVKVTAHRGYKKLRALLEAKP